ncbi:MAG: hypothetical protein DHS20C20_14380 [Ardenticatenaceae bacterium]|nr:MAG: hypothetical protein DHS20C20_14380 [Ardenticatenaceae bacterium]
MANSERNAQLEQLLHAINHDLRTPLGNIRSATAILLQDLNDSITEDQRLFLDIIESSIVRILDQSNRLSLFGEIAFGQSKPEAVHLSEILANTSKNLRNSYEIENVTFITNKDQLVTCHPHILATLLALLTAGDFQQHPKTADIPPPIIEVTTELNQVRFIVTTQLPNCEGIPRFAKLASEIAKMQGGTLEIASDNGRKLFTFTIPHIAPEA